jgi:hypothetical protein
VAREEKLADAPRQLLPEPEPAPMILEAYLDDSGLVQVLSATPEPEPARAAETKQPLLLPERTETVERQRARAFAPSERGRLSWRAAATRTRSR